MKCTHGTWYHMLFLFFCFPLWAGESLVPQLEKTPLLHWNPPKVTHFQLDNGLEVYALENHELPMVNVALYLRAGELDSPQKMDGLADLTAELIVEGGVEGKTPEEVDAWLDNQAMEFESHTGNEGTMFTMSSLSESWEEGVSFLWQALFHPAFDPKRFDTVQKKKLNGLKRSLDLPEVLAERAFKKAIYGEKSPWGSSMTQASLKKIAVKDLREFHKKYFGLQNMVLGISGDFSLAQLHVILAQTTQNLPQGEKHLRHWNGISFSPKAKTEKISKKVTQAIVEVGHLALPRFDPDYYAYDLLQYVLGGSGFTSRLTQDIRTERGLAYAATSGWEDNPERGSFKIFVATRAEKQKEVLERIRFHLTNIMGEGAVTQKELDEAKQSILSQYIFKFATPFQLLLERLRNDVMGYPADYLEKYPEEIKKVTVADLKRVAQKYLRPDALTTVIVAP